MKTCVDRLRNEGGFTLIELLIAAAIIAILAVLAIPNYALFKTRAFNAAAESDVRHLLPAAELVASEGGLPGPVVIDGSGGRITQLAAATTSPGVQGFVDVDANDFFVELGHQKGSLTYQFDSQSGWAVLEN